MVAFFFLRNVDTDNFYDSDFHIIITMARITITEQIEFVTCEDAIAVAD